MKKLRKKILKIDKKIIKLLARRFALIEKIGEYKKQNNLEVEDKKREEELKEIYKKELKKTNLEKDDILEIFDLIFKISKKRQR